MSTSTPETSTTGNPPSYDEFRQQAGPLPSKRGELGFIEGVHVQQVGAHANASTVALPARHPADRDGASTQNDEEAPAVPPSARTVPNSNSRTNEGSSPTTPVSSKPRILHFLKPKKIKCLGGVRHTTCLAFAGQLLILIACVVAWVFTSRKVASLASEAAATRQGGIPSSIFIHVIFAFVLIGQFIFLERRVYRIRAERYAFLHPGEMLPRYWDRTQQGGDLTFAYAPWNRAPLPTYAAALAQSGHGTGDVDDHLIAVPPPPAYGNTRGSTMILQGFLTDTLRAQRPASVHIPADLERGDRRADEDGNREQQREQTLAQLENSRNRN